MIERLLIVGASVRAAAMSARRAGFAPIAIDRFADGDLRRVCSEVLSYSRLGQFPELANRMPPADWMYTGPLENCPELVSRLAGRRVLLGNNIATLQRLRDPWLLAESITGAGLRSPELIPRGELPRDSGWLQKPLRAAGGFAVERMRVMPSSRPAHHGPVYYQKFIAGRCIGATFLGAQGRSVLLGTTEQLLGSSWGASREFQYVGSCGPISLPPQHIRALSDIGQCLSAIGPVQGLFGVDAVVNDEGVWIVEVNPRYTSSVEILERAFDISTTGWHVAACRRGELPRLAREHARQLDGHCRRTRIERHGKAVVYADCDIAIDSELEQELSARSALAAHPMVADIPVAGTRIEKGEPIVTVFAQGRTTSEVKLGLRTARDDVMKLLNRG